MPRRETRNVGAFAAVFSTGERVVVTEPQLSRVRISTTCSLFHGVTMFDGRPRSKPWRSCLIICDPSGESAYFIPRRARGIRGSGPQRLVQCRELTRQRAPVLCQACEGS